MSYSMQGLGAIPSQLGQIRSKGGYVYQLTPDDLLWLARSVQFEGGDHPSTMWTYAQRQVMRRRTGSLESLVRGHSQPVNPKWESLSSEGCQRSPQRCTPAELERRRQARTMPWDSLRSEVRNKVIAWATAEMPNPVPRSTDFANAPVSRSFIAANPGTEIVKQAGNWYLAEVPALGWPADFVTIHLGDRVAGPGGSAGFVGTLGAPLVGIVLLGVGAAFAGWAFWRSRR